MTAEADRKAAQNALAAILDRKMPIDKVRQFSELPHGYDMGLWAELASDFGIGQMHLPEGPGGPVDLDMVSSVAEVFGSRLSPLPYLSTVVLAGLTLSRARRTEAGERLIGQLREGAATATFAHPVVPWERVGSTVTGHAPYVLNGCDSDWILMVVDGRLLGARGGPGVSAVRLRPIDATRPAARMQFDKAAIAELGFVSDCAMAQQQKDLMIYLAHESAAGVRRVCDMAVEYVKVRRQFGRPIGSFQAIKHLAADLAIDVAATSAAARKASAEANTDAGQTVLKAHLFISETFVRAARSSLHAHGGIGFTWEFDSHLYYRRAYGNLMLAGRRSDLQGELARLLLTGYSESQVAASLY